MIGFLADFYYILKNTLSDYNLSVSDCKLSAAASYPLKLK